MFPSGPRESETDELSVHPIPNVVALTQVEVLSSSPYNRIKLGNQCVGRQVSRLSNDRF